MTLARTKSGEEKVDDSPAVKQPLQPSKRVNRIAQADPFSDPESDGEDTKKMNHRLRKVNRTSLAPSPVFPREELEDSDGSNSNDENAVPRPSLKKQRLII